ncbi:MAG: DapH/DapD/GlmU-related protein [Bacteroidota bacterium]
MNNSHIVIVGTGAEARLAADIFIACDQVVLGFLKTDAEDSVRDLNDISVFAVLGEEDSLMVLQDERIQYLVAVADIAERKRIYELTASLTKRPSANATHTLAWVSPNANVGFGNLFNAQVAINANAKIGDMNHFHSCASVEPDAEIGNYCTIGAGARIGSKAKVGDNAFIGTGAVIYPGVTLGKGCMVGAGSVVIKEVPEGAVVNGNPAVQVGS